MRTCVLVHMYAYAYVCKYIYVYAFFYSECYMQFGTGVLGTSAWGGVYVTQVCFYTNVHICDTLTAGCAHEVKIAFITGNSSLEPLIEGLCAQIHVNLR